MKRLILFVFAIIVLASCNKDIDQMPVDPENPGGISSIADNIVVPPLGNEDAPYYFVFAAEESWSISNIDDWLKISTLNQFNTAVDMVVNGKSYPAGTVRLRLKADCYSVNDDNHDNRDCKLVIQAGHYKKTINVSQAKPYISINIDRLDKDIVGSGEDKHEEEEFKDFPEKNACSVPFFWFEGNDNSKHNGQVKISVESNIPWTFESAVERTNLQQRQVFDSLLSTKNRGRNNKV